jgi:hypothetical protein
MKRRKIVGTVFIAMSCYYASQVFTDVTLGKSSDHWKRTSGVIVTSDVALDYARKGSNYNPVVEYTYQAGGNECKSSRISFPQPTSEAHDRALTFVQDYPVGKQLDVYYDPNKPSDACLTKGIKDSYLGSMATFIGIMLVIGLLCVIL